jgi:hypothetical protein
MLPSSVISIGYAAFGGCTSLIAIMIPEKVISIGYATFDGCDTLNSSTRVDIERAYALALKVIA